MSQQGDRIRARQNRLAPRKSAARRRHAERLIAQVRDARARREALTAELDLTVGSLLAEIKDIGWPSARETAAACGLPVHEAGQLRRLAQAAVDPDAPSTPAPTLDGPMTPSHDQRRGSSDQE